MKTLITIVLACLSVGSLATPIASFRPSNSAGFIFRKILLPGLHTWVFDQRTTSPDAKRNVSDDVTEAPVTEKLHRGGRDAVEEAPISFGESDLFLPLFDTRLASSARRDEGSGALLFPGNTPPSRVPQESTNPSDEGSGDFVFPKHITLRQEVTTDGQVQQPCSLQAGAILVNGTCERLLSKGPCAEGEWLLLRDNRTECAPRPCPFGQLEYEERCVNASDVSMCDQGQILYVDFTGFTMCDCETDFFYDPWSGNCYAQHEKGPCGFRQYLEVSDSGSVECVENDCVTDGYIRDSNFSGCFRKMYRGFCEQKFLIFHHNNKTAECFAIDIRNIFDVTTLRACPSGSLRDYLGECREQFRLPSVSSDPMKYGTCPPAYIRDPRGTCRRVHNVLG